MIILLISTGIACTVSLGNKVLHKNFLNKYNKNKKLYEKDQQTNNSFDKLYRISLQDNVIDKIEYESLCNIASKNVDETKNKYFHKLENKVKFLLVILN